MLMLKTNLIFGLGISDRELLVNKWSTTKCSYKLAIHFKLKFNGTLMHEH